MQRVFRRFFPAIWLAAGSLAAGLLPTSATAQMSQAPPAVGVVAARRIPIIETNEFIGRVQAVSRVALVARVTAFLEQRLFVEGSEVKRGDLLYRLEQPPFQADVQARQAAVAQASALLENATITLNRAQALLHTPAGQRSTVDDALAQQRSYAAQVLSAQANLTTAEINLSYTEIHAPIDGKISRTNVTEGNVVGPSSGTLATIVSQDPMYVLFPMPTRTALELRNRYKGAEFGAVVVRIRLPTGRLYPVAGRLDYTDPTISTNTDTITARAVIANPLTPGENANQPGARPLVDGEFVTVLVQGITPVEVLGIPRAAVLSDQQGDYVFVVNGANRALQRRVQLGQSTPSVAAVISGLADGEQVIVDGIQRVHAGQVVSPAPATPGFSAAGGILQGDLGGQGAAADGGQAGGGGATPQSNGSGHGAAAGPGAGAATPGTGATGGMPSGGAPGGTPPQGGESGNSLGGAPRGAEGPAGPATGARH